MDRSSRPGHDARDPADLETGFGQQDDDHSRQEPVPATLTDGNHVRRLQDRLSAYFKTIMINWLPPLLFIGKIHHTDVMTSGSAVAFGILSIVSLSLHYFGLFPRGREAQHVERLCNFAYASTMLRMLAAFVLLLFYEVVYYGVIAPLVAFLALLWLLKRTTRSGHIDSAMYYSEPHDHGTQLEFMFDLSVLAVSMGFSGLCGAVLGYVKNSLDLTKGHKSPECFMFYGTAIGLLVELLATVPPYAVLERMRRRVVTVYLRFLAYAAMLFLVMACLAAAEAILHEHIFFAFFPDVVVVALCFLKSNTDSGRDLERDGSRTDDDRKADLKRCLHLALAGIHAAMFPVLMASYSTYVGNDDPGAHGVVLERSLRLSWPFKGFVLAMLSSIVTYFTGITVVLETQHLNSNAFPKQAWAWATYLLMAVTGIFVVPLLVLQRDELLSII